MCWFIRSVRGGRWSGAATRTPSAVEMEKAAADLTPRTQDNGGLSVYLVGDETDERLTAVLHTVLVRKPEKMHFLRIRYEHLKGLPLRIEMESSPQQHPYLGERHGNMYNDNHPEAALRLARVIWAAGPSVLAFSREEIKAQGRELLNDPRFAGHFAFPEAYLR